MTSDERTWKFDRPVIFLGEWCRHYKRKHIWSKMDAIVAEPYGVSAEEKMKDRKLVVSLYNDLIEEVTIIMNQLHGTNHKARYWTILMGPWLYSYTKMIINRYATLEAVFNNYEISGVTVIEPESYLLAMKNTLNFILGLGDACWNLALYSKILQHKTYCGLGVEYLKVGPTTFPVLSAPKNGMKKKIIFLIRKVLPLFSRQSDAFIINSFLPIKDEVLLQLSLGQVPQFWRSPNLIDTAVDAKLRSSLNFTDVDCSGIYLFSRKLLIETIPVCYLEGYTSLIQQLKALNWPKNPQFIFTSNSFHVDEVFKAWVGNKVVDKVPYYIGQHGANYGTLYGYDVWSECRACDKFFSWGWELPSPDFEVVPAFNFKIVNKKIKKSILTGGLLLIERGPGHRDGPQDRTFEHILYQDYIFQFFRTLPYSIQDETLVRLHHGSTELVSSDEYLWGKNFPSIKIDLYNNPLDKLISQHKLIVFAYESAGMLETLALNIPTISFWREGFDHILPSAKPYYELLESVGIIARTPEDAANHITKNWNDLESWWYSDTLQEARITFCNQYSQMVNNPVLTLKSLLTSN